MAAMTTDRLAAVLHLLAVAAAREIPPAVSRAAAPATVEILLATELPPAVSVQLALLAVEILLAAEIPLAVSRVAVRATAEILLAAEIPLAVSRVAVRATAEILLAAEIPLAVSPEAALATAEILLAAGIPLAVSREAATAAADLPLAVLLRLACPGPRALWPVSRFPETDRVMPRPSPDAGPSVLPRPGEWQPHELYAPEPNDNDSKDKDHKSLAKTRGRDWALRDANHKSTPITRHIQVECYLDRLVLVPEGGVGPRKVIPLGPRTAGSIDKFTAAVWEQMDSWGMAGNGMYWHPVLNVRVAPDAQRRFDDFRSLLKDSGLMIERTQ